MRSVVPDTQEQIKFNIQVHDRIVRSYDVSHGEIFNEVEQERLSRMLKQVLQMVRSGSDPLRVLDYGCGSGNLTCHLLGLNVDVVAADVSSRFLTLVRQRFSSDRLSTLRLNGVDLSEVKSDSFDFIAVYSVLHHIPNYLAAIVELARICKPGGVIYLDHEPNDLFWSNNVTYVEFQSAVFQFDWRKYLVWSNYVDKVRRWFDPKYTNEGDIHVWPDDHIEWQRIEETLTGIGFEVVLSEEYLLFKRIYRHDIYKKYENLCTDTRLMAFRKHQT